MSDKPEQNEGLKVKHVNNPFPVEEVYVDGVSGVTARGGVVKLNCYRVTGFDQNEKAEIRQHTHRLVMPASALPEMMRVMQQVANTVKANQEQREPKLNS